MADLPKFSSGTFDDPTEFAYPDLFEREKAPAYERLVIGARADEIPLMLDLTSEMRGPFCILYVLLLSRCGRQPGRYQSPDPLDHVAVTGFLQEHREFLEQDGRHHVWVMSAGSEGQLIYDHHNVIYGYGDLDSLEQKLVGRGFTEGRIVTPVPHAHRYHAEFDAAEDAVMDAWDWQWFALQPLDDP